MSDQGNVSKVVIFEDGERVDEAAFLDFVNSSISSENRRRVQIDPGGGTGSPGGTDRQIQYNDSGSFGGTAGITFTTGGDLRLGDEVELQFGDGNDRQILFDGSTFSVAGGALSLSNNNIISVGTVDGVDVSNHSGRHEDGGADELDAADLSGASGSEDQVPGVGNLVSVQVSKSTGGTINASIRVIGRVRGA